MTMNHLDRSHPAWLVMLACLTTSGAACTGSHAATPAPAASPAADPAPPARPAPPDTQPGADACGAISDWRPEIIELPPEFAPTLPAGQEELRFAPGMFEPADATYFTYAFVLRLAEPHAAPANSAQLESLLDRYYQGLVAAVARSRGLTLPVERVDATVTGQAPSFQATVTMYDAFVTGAPLTLHMDLTLSGACVRAAASPQPRTHEVWQQLARAAACLPCTP
jgi:hypothetical protein